MKKLTKKIILLSLSILTFTGSLVCAVYCGAFFQKNPSQAIKLLIDEECKEQECGEAIYGTISYTNNDSNITKVNTMKQQFDEVLNNQLSKAEFNVSISVLNHSFDNITIMETKSYDKNYDTMHIYSNTSWYYFDDEPDSIYISTSLEKQIINGTNRYNSKGLEMTITANGITKALIISGTYETNIYPKRKGSPARSDGLISAFGETILMHEETLLEFLPTDAISMFTTSSSNNGEKYKALKETALKCGFGFEFNIDPLPDSSLNNNIRLVESFYYSSSRTGAGIGFLFATIILVVLFFVVFVRCLKEIELLDNKTKRNNIITILILLSIILISAVVLIIFKKCPMIISSYISISMLNTISMFIFSGIILLIIIFILFRQKRTVLQIFKEKENNSEFDY